MGNNPGFQMIIESFFKQSPIPAEDQREKILMFFSLMHLKILSIFRK